MTLQDATQALEELGETVSFALHGLVSGSSVLRMGWAEIDAREAEKRMDKETVDRERQEVAAERGRLSVLLAEKANLVVAERSLREAQDKLAMDRAAADEEIKTRMAAAEEEMRVMRASLGEEIASRREEFEAQIAVHREQAEECKRQALAREAAAATAEANARAAIEATGSAAQARIDAAEAKASTCEVAAAQSVAKADAAAMARIADAEHRFSIRSAELEEAAAAREEAAGAAERRAREAEARSAREGAIEVDEMHKAMLEEVMTPPLS